MKLSRRTAIHLTVPFLALTSAACSGGSAAENTSTTNQALDQAALAAVKQYPWKDVCPAAKAGPDIARCFAKVRTNDAGDITTSMGPNGGYTPADLVSAYDLQTNTYTDIVAVVDAMDNPDAESDLATYRAQFGLPPCTTANGCFQKVNQDGQASNYPTASTDWGVEIALDIEMAGVGCPNCKILLVEANSQSQTDLGAAVNTAVSMGAAVVSNSYGFPEASTQGQLDTEFYHHIGVAIFASAGDSGYGVSYPSSGQWVIGVGGTTLTTSTSARGWAESAWSDGGGGCSHVTPEPPWQHHPGCAHKMVSDLSAVADPNTGVALFDQFGAGGWTVVGGTSVSSPLVASIFTGTGHATAYGHTVWHHQDDFTDITTGSNGTCVTQYFCNAEVGYDSPTGWGTPIGFNLARWGVAPSDLEINNGD
jgi:subtilase family serine protease